MPWGGPSTTKYQYYYQGGASSIVTTTKYQYYRLYNNALGGVGRAASFTYISCMGPQHIIFGNPMAGSKFDDEEDRYTRSPFEDSRLLGPSPWKILATTCETNDSWATQPLAKIF